MNDTLAPSLIYPGKFRHPILVLIFFQAALEMDDCWVIVRIYSSKRLELNLSYNKPGALGGIFVKARTGIILCRFSLTLTFNDWMCFTSLNLAFREDFRAQSLFKTLRQRSLILFLLFCFHTPARSITFHVRQSRLQPRHREWRTRTHRNNIIMH